MDPNPGLDPGVDPGLDPGVDPMRPLLSGQVLALLRCLLKVGSVGGGGCSAAGEAVVGSGGRGGGDVVSEVGGPLSGTLLCWPLSALDLSGQPVQDTGRGVWGQL